jgi:Uma2 family endonuclease
MADFKVRLEINREDIFYYPDVMVACQRVGVEQYFLRYPTLVVEVLSPSTEMIDRREKMINYAQIPTLEEYVLVAQDAMEITLHRRSERWAPHVLTSAEALAEFRSIRLTLSLEQIYAGIEWS